MSMMSSKKLLMAGARPMRPQDVFATSLYTGNGSSQTITNGLDLAGKGGLVWGKSRSDAGDHVLVDTVRGGNLALTSNNTTPDNDISPGLAFLPNGFSLRNTTSRGGNNPGTSYAAWSFRRAAKFFDIVTYTGNGVAGRQIPHGLGVVPGMIVVKARQIDDWFATHRSMAVDRYLRLNATDAIATGGAASIANASATSFSPGVLGNTNGQTYVAYLFAQNPDLIDCGSYVGNGSATGPVVTCGSGWAPQFLLIKNATGTGNWHIIDTARNPSNPRNSVLFPNTGGAEFTDNNFNVGLSATGFQPLAGVSNLNASGNTYICLAIRSPT